MLKDVTLGRYYSTVSILHALDPRTKLFGLLVYIVSVFLYDSWSGLAFSVSVLSLFIVLSRVPLSYMVKGLRSVVFIVVLASVLNFLLGKGGIRGTVFSTVRIVSVVLASNVLTLTTRPREISSGIEKSLSFLSFFKVPVEDIATIISLALRFIPILSDEAGRILDSQKSRGARLGEGSVREKARAVLPVVVPLFISAFRRSDELSRAMDSRLYGTGKRRSWKRLEYSSSDVYGYVASLSVLVISIILRCSDVF
ncbi:MAG: energy-coupling factor transporter transmembrane component T family protein [Candidatus Ornithospirochaeta sp.]